MSTSRLAGLFYLSVFLTGAAALAGGRLIVSGNAAATAANILSHQGAFQFGPAANVSGGPAQPFVGRGTARRMA